MSFSVNSPTSKAKIKTLAATSTTLRGALFAARALVRIAQATKQRATRERRSSDGRLGRLGRFVRGWRGCGIGGGVHAHEKAEMQSAALLVLVRRKGGV